MASDTMASSQSGLTEKEAQEFHAQFIKNMGYFAIIAGIAHLLVWFWRPWIPGQAGWDVAEAVANTPLNMLIG